MLRIITISVFLAISFTQSNESRSLLTGNANFYYISKLDNGQIIKMPYRMLNTTWANQHRNFELIGTISLEYQPIMNNYSFKMNNPQDFLFDLRELYMAWVLNFGEIRIGKQIQSWGFVDENSPLDNLSAYDYNFLFESGSDRKIGTNSLSADFYYNNFTFGFSLSPFHSTNRLPSSNAEFPIELPVIPNDHEFLDIEDVTEYGLYSQLSTDFIDFGVSYFSGYDRIFNLSGINISLKKSSNEPFNTPDTVFTYRKTDVVGVSSAIIVGDLTLRSDIGKFSTKDQNKNIEREYPDPNNEIPDGYLADTLYNSYPINESAEYYQMTFQLEYDLPNNFDLLLQYFEHDTLSYSAIKPIDQDLNITGFDINEIEPYNYFFPGMGSPLALMTNRAILVGLRKSFLNEKLTLQLRNLMDLDYNGYFLELNADYKLTDRVTSSFAINYIHDDQTHPNSITVKGDEYEAALDYSFNQMKDFSHLRMQVKYSF